MAAEVRPAAISQYSLLKAWRYFGFFRQGREMEMRLQRSQSFATSLSLLGIDLVSTQDGTRDQPLREAFQTFCLMACSKHRCYKSVLFFELPKIVSETYFQMNKISVSAILPALVVLASTLCWEGLLVLHHATGSSPKEMLSEEVLHLTACFNTGVRAFPFPLNHKSLRYYSLFLTLTDFLVKQRHRLAFCASVWG